MRFLKQFLEATSRDRILSEKKIKNLLQNEEMREEIKKYL
jgi:hypothetical protein